MTIDEVIQGLTGEHFYLNHEHIRHDAIKAAVVILKDYERIQADYENRLKADMVAMLTELQLDIEESENCGKAFHLGLQMANNIIQQKINSLKEDTT